MTHDISQNLITLLGLEHAPNEEQAAALDTASEAVIMALLQRIEERLTDAEREEFYRLLETDTTDEEKAAFFSAHAPDAKDILIEEITRVKESALEQNLNQIPKTQ